MCRYTSRLSMGSCYRARRVVGVALGQDRGGACGKGGAQSRAVPRGLARSPEALPGPWLCPTKAPAIAAFGSGRSWCRGSSRGFGRYGRALPARAFRVRSAAVQWSARAAAGGRLVACKSTRCGGNQSSAMRKVRPGRRFSAFLLE